MRDADKEGDLVGGAECESHARSHFASKGGKKKEEEVTETDDTRL